MSRSVRRTPSGCSPRHLPAGLRLPVLAAAGNQGEEPGTARTRPGRLIRLGRAGDDEKQAFPAKNRRRGPPPGHQVPQIAKAVEKRPHRSRGGHFFDLEGNALASWIPTQMGRTAVPPTSLRITYRHVGDRVHDQASDLHFHFHTPPHSLPIGDRGSSTASPGGKL